MIRYYITDRSQAGGRSELMALARKWMSREVEFIQLRDKALDARELLSIARELVHMARDLGVTRVLVNSRTDVAIAAGASGVHLPAGSLAPHRIKAIAPAGFLVAVSCHDAQELDRATAEGADFAVLGPVFVPLSKQHAGPVLGLDGFADLIRGRKLPVLALGGITWENADQCMAAGAAGIAGISLFQR